MQRQRTPNTATLLTTLAFSGDVKVLYALAKYPFGAGRRGSALWTTMRCCFGAIDSFEMVVGGRCNGRWQNCFLGEELSATF